MSESTAKAIVRKAPTRLASRLERAPGQRADSKLANDY